MPLLGKTAFTRQTPPIGLRPDDDVFFCKVTGEVFSDYTKFFDQSILCNSVIWTCAITGKHNLTFQEAKDSEEKALQTIVFPRDLQRPLLFLSSLTRRRNASDITEDLYRFAKRRFFIGEVVDVIVSGAKKSGIIKKIMAAKLEGTSDLNGGESEDAVNHSADADDDEEEETRVSAGDALSYQYIIQESSVGGVIVVDARNISRKKGGVTRERCGLFVRQHCSFSSQKGFWIVKADFLEKFNLQTAKFSDFFVGSTPVFEKSPMKKPAVQPIELDSDEEKEEEDDDDEEEDLETEKEKMTLKEGRKKRKDDEENEEERLIQLAKMKEKVEKQQKREELKRKAEEEKVKKKEEKHRRKEEKKEQEKHLREWNKPRDDLGCEDLKDLPLSTPVTYCLSECFGDVLMVLEYLRSFKATFEIDVPSNLSVAVFCQSIMESKVDGLFANLVQQLLEAIFHMELDYDDRGNVFGIPLKKLQLDGYSLTEVLRRHFTKAQLTIGGNDGLASAFADETGSEFIRLHPSIVQKMAKKNIFDLSPVDKLKILSALVNQLLMFPTSRALIEDNYERLKQSQRSLRIHQVAVQKRERDEMQYNAKKKFEERMKEQSKNPEGCESSSLANGKATEKDESAKKTRKKRSITELSERDFEMMPVENIDWDQLSVEEKKCIKDWSARKEKELVSEVVKLQPTSAIFPIGRDRSYRRYWVLPSVPGIFVEDDDEFVSDDCLLPVKQNSSKSVDDKKSDVKMVSDDAKDGIGYVSLETQLKERGRVRWSFYNTPTQLDALILALNPRGFREGQLRQALEEQKDDLLEWMKQRGSSSHLLTLSISKPIAMKSEDNEGDASSSSSAVVSADGCRGDRPSSSAGEACLEKALREMILDMEERIHFGSLGALKVSSRSEWRQEVEKCSRLNLPSPSTTQDSSDQTSSNPHSSSADNPHSSSADNPHSSAADNPHSSAAALQEETNDDGLKVNSCPQEAGMEDSVIRDLSQALLQVLKMIEAKYLIPPLGEDEETKKTKQKLALEGQTSEANAELNGSSSIAIANEPEEQSVVEKWMESVGSASSLSQLYVLLSLLETSVAWSKSALHARCRICRRKTDGEHMLLCDGCDRGHHMYCLKPRITVVPSGDWFCPSCRPKDFIHLASTPRMSFTEETTDSESSSENHVTEEEEEEGGSRRNEREEEEEEEEARSTSGSREDLRIYNERKEEEEDTDAEKDDEDDDDDDDENDDDYRPKHIDNNGSAKKSSASTHKRGRRGRGGKGGSGKKWRQNDSDDYEDDDDDDESRRGRGGGSSLQKRRLHSTRARLNDSKRSSSSSSLKRSRGVLTSGVATTSSSALHGKRKSCSGVVEPVSDQRRRSRGRPPRLSLESAVARGKRKIPTDWNDEEDANTKRKKYSPIKSHFRAAENSMTICEELVKELIKHDSCWPFRRPVTQRDAVDYFDIVKQPMDFQTIQNKIYRYQYFTSSALLQDIHLIIYNCFLYNKPGTPVHSAGIEFEDFLNRRCKELNLGSQSQASSKHRKRTL